MDTKSKRRVMSLTVDERRERRNSLNRVARFRLKEEAIAYMGGKCCHCGGVFHSSCYDFHHTDPAQKDVDPGALFRCKKERLYEELSKCILLCANCHRKYHWAEANKDTDWEETPVEVISLEIDGENKTLKEWAESSGLKYETIRARIQDYGWTPKEAVTIPARKRRKVNYDGSRLDLDSKEESYKEASEEESGQNPTVLCTP